MRLGCSCKLVVDVLHKNLQKTESGDLAPLAVVPFPDLDVIAEVGAVLLRNVDQSNDEKRLREVYRVFTRACRTV